MTEFGLAQYRLKVNDWILDMSEHLFVYPNRSYEIIINNNITIRIKLITLNP